LLNLESIFKAKLAAFYQRESRNDYGDLEWMCENLGLHIGEFANRLDVEHRDFFAGAFADSDIGYSQQQINAIYSILGLS
jgi:hypothetical protein